MLTDLRLYPIDDSNSFRNKFSAYPSFLHKCAQTFFSVKKEVPLIQNIYGHYIRLHPLPFKYGSIITGNGPCPPSSQILKPGVKLEVHCIQPLQTLYIKGPQTIKLDHPCVPNSVFLIHESHSTPLAVQNFNEPIFDISSENYGFISYCPILFMILINFDVKFTEEHGEGAHWTIILEEY
ncbi:hypothetical protein P618_200902 [Holospora obtusa F1]|uniref:Uncharacterized protein n=1 Tax=Holospora obtusa F1 TaxID=1399147 RepID=W6TE68_HOLOB|nr:hypothetical protein [Holospora obtusa]ETZ06929.1 hypothetical protein P618_200902 [Holospora obtusa F1]